MKIISIVVDELPKSCINCDFVEFDDGDYNCPIANVDRYDDYRHHDCPLRVEKEREL